jgi:voltage-gated potassium channel
MITNQAYIKFRKRAFELIESKTSFRGWPLFIDSLVVGVILINITTLILASIESIYLQHRLLFAAIELLSVIFFTVEFIVRLWVSKDAPEYQSLKYPRLKYAGSFYAVIDLLAVLPFYLAAFGMNLKFLLLLRLFRLLKIFRYFRALQIIGRVFQSKAHELYITVFFTLTVSLFISFVMYYVEGKHQPESFGSIPEAMWWTVITLTTVGYGDVVPVTLLGKFMGGIIALLGIGIFALPAGILASGFSNELQRLNDEETSTKEFNCPHCGKALHNIDQ